MNNERVTRVVVVGLFVLAAISLLVGLITALSFLSGLSSVGLGMGWGGWVTLVGLALVVGAVLGAAGLFMMGALLLFLTQIERNLQTARQQPGATAAARPATPAPQPAATAAPSATPRSAAFRTERRDIIPPDVPAPSIAPGETTKVLREAKVEVQPPKVDVQPPKVEVQPPKVEAQAPKVEVQPPKVEAQAPKVEVQPPKVEAATPDRGQPAAPLPGAEEAARIAAELAAQKKSAAQE